MEDLSHFFRIINVTQIVNLLSRFHCLSSFIISSWTFWKVLINVANQSESKKISVNSTISLKGIVKAIFNDTVHVQIGGKIITIPASDFGFEKAPQ